MPADRDSFGATIHQIVEALRDSDVSRIFWLNLCAHLQEGVVEEHAAAEVLKTAWRDFQQAYDAQPLPQRGMALLGCIIQACASNETALGGVSRLAALALDELEEISVVLDGRLLWQYYLEADKDSLDRALQQLPGSESLHELEEARIGELVLEACWKAGYTDLLSIFDSLAKEATLQTRVKRLWTSLAEGDRPKDPHRLVQRLGIAAFAEGAWVVEMVYRRQQLEAALPAGDERFLQRPTAFCVNDVHAPRFRGLARREVGARRRGEPIESVGRTVDLHGWREPGDGWAADDGLPELMCPALRWQAGLLPHQVRLVGSITRRLAGPSNEQFADHLEDFYRDASVTEAAVIEQLAGIG